MFNWLARSIKFLLHMMNNAVGAVILYYYT